MFRLFLRVLWFLGWIVRVIVLEAISSEIESLNQILVLLWIIYANRLLGDIVEFIDIFKTALGALLVWLLVLNVRTDLDRILNFSMKLLFEKVNLFWTAFNTHNLIITILFQLFFACFKLDNVRVIWSFGLFLVF